MNAGAVEARYKYYAFGKVAAVSIAGGAWSATNWDALPLALTTHMVAGGKKHYYLDLETGLYLLGAGNPDGGGRYYDAKTGQFESEDPDRQSKGDPNLFLYGQNNPVNRLDPSAGRRAPADRVPLRRRRARSGVSGWSSSGDCDGSLP